MNLKIALITILASVVLGENQSSNKNQGLTRHKCIRRKEMIVKEPGAKQIHKTEAKNSPPDAVIAAPMPQPASEIASASNHKKPNPVVQSAPKQEKHKKAANKDNTPPKTVVQSAPKQENHKKAANKDNTPPKTVVQPAPKQENHKKSATKDNTLNEFELDCFNQHNHYRRSLVTTKGEPVVELKWRKDLAEKAKIWADKLVQDSIASYGGIGLGHSTQMNWGFGENLYSTKNGNQTCACATDAWFNEWPLYKNEQIPGGDFSGYGHYTQLAWPWTKYIGCAYGMNGNNIKFTVCEYDPPGNMMGMKLDVLVKGKQV